MRLNHAVAVVRQLMQYWRTQYKWLLLSLMILICGANNTGKPMKPSWMRLYKIIYQPKTIIILTLAALLFIFHTPFKLLLQLILVDHVMSHFPKGAIIDCIIILLSILLGIWLLRKGWLRYRPSFAQKLLVCFILISYLYYRNSNDWEFHSFGFTNSVYHADFLWFFLCYPLGRIIRFHIIHSKQNSINSFIEDSPLGMNTFDPSSETSELVIRKKFAADLAKKIGNQTFKQSFAIAIIGPWGNGKTSFLNHIYSNLSNDKNRLQIRFNPFSNFDEKVIILQFFNAVSAAILPFDGRLSAKITDYASLLVKLIGEEKATKGLSIAIGHFIPKSEPSVKHKLDEISVALEVLGKQLIIYIDDVDRLSQKEIVHVLMLIRNTANLPNTVYIIPCDKEYVTKALQNRSEFRGEKFLEKFFQLEFVLPAYDPLLIRKYFYTKIEEQLTRNITVAINNEKKNLSNLSDYLTSENDIEFDKYIRNYRDAIRLANNFCFDYEQIQGEVDLKDFLLLELIKLNYSTAYSYFANNYDRFLIETAIGTNFTDPIYKLRKPGLLGTEEEGEYILISEIQLKYEQMGIQLPDISHIKELFLALFSLSDDFSDLSIRRKDNIEQYFSLRLLAGGISHKEFLEVIRLPVKLLDIQLPQNWLGNGVDIQVLNKCKIYKPQTQDELLRIIDLSIILGRKGTNQLIYSEAIKAITQNFINDLVGKKTISSDKVVLEYVIYEYCLVDKAIAPYAFESDLLSTIVKNKIVLEWPGFIEIGSKLILEYLTKYLELINKLDNFVYLLFWNAIKHYPKETQEIFNSFIEEIDPEGFINSIIRAEPFEQAYKLDDNVSAIFGNEIKKFEDYLKKLRASPAIIEAVRFFSLLKLNNYKWYLVYNFQYLKPFLPPTITNTAVFKTEFFVEIEDVSFYDILSEKRGSLLWNQNNENIDFVFDLLTDDDKKIIFIRHTGNQKVSNIISIVEMLLLTALRTISDKIFDSEKIEPKNYYEEAVWITNEAKPLVTIISLQTTLK
ncbi:MAG: P-loop NTPase fold protein [Bacteroidia bacterium]